MKLSVSFPNLSVAASELFKLVTNYWQHFQDHSSSIIPERFLLNILPHLLLVPGEMRKGRFMCKLASGVSVSETVWVIP